MKTSFLTNLLVVFALGLCGLCTFQWLRETDTRQQTQTLLDTQFRLLSDAYGGIGDTRGGPQGFL